MEIELVQYSSNCKPYLLLFVLVWAPHFGMLLALILSSLREPSSLTIFHYSGFL